MFCYKRTPGYNGQESIKILSVYGYDGVVQIPEEIDGAPVTEVAAYAFSQGRGADKMLADEGKDGLVWGEYGEPCLHTEQSPRICGLGLKEIYLPGTLKKIGNYAFYLCDDLKTIHCSSAATDLGAGLFTGCSGLRYIDMLVVGGEKSCLKEMLSELRQEIDLDYRCSAGMAKLVFPELYEESVENTPARIVTRQMHGCGHRYRYCFEGTEFQFHRYDALFPHVRVQEPERLVVRLVMGRLRYPLSLYDQDKLVYEEYLREHFNGAGHMSLEAGDTEGVCWLAERYGESREKLENLSELAGNYKNAEAVSFLMNLTHRRFPGKKRKFVL